MHRSSSNWHTRICYQPQPSTAINFPTLMGSDTKTSFMVDTENSTSTTWRRTQPPHSLQNSKQCSLSCQCQCHKSGSIYVPLLWGILGSLHFCYTGNVLRPNECSDSSCMRLSIARFLLVFIFPESLFRTAIS